MQHALTAMGPASAVEGGLRNHGTTLPTHLLSYSTTGLVTYASPYSFLSKPTAQNTPASAAPEEATFRIRSGAHQQ